MLCISPARRLTARKALEHHWVRAADFSEDDRSDSDLIVDEFDDDTGPPPGCMAKSGGKGLLGKGFTYSTSKTYIYMICTPYNLIITGRVMLYVDIYVIFL